MYTLAAFGCFVMVWSLRVVICQPSSPTGGLSQYIEYHPGNSSLILTIPHNGGQQPGNLPDRTVCAGEYRGCNIGNECVFSHDLPLPSTNCNCQSSACDVNYLSDSYTKTIGFGLRDKIFALTGKQAYVVFSDLQRRKLDANREVNEATFGHPVVVNAFESYNYFIQLAKYHISQNGPGLLLDMHGQSHSEQWTEFGYDISTSRLNADAYTPNVREGASNCAVILRECGNDTICFRNVIRGQRSLGEILSSYGYSTIPSIANPAPGTTSYNYFNGGETLEVHGSADCSSGSGEIIDAVQVEMPSTVRFGLQSRTLYIDNLALSVVQYMNDLYPNW